MVRLALWGTSLAERQGRVGFSRTGATQLASAVVVEGVVRSRRTGRVLVRCWREDKSMVDG